MVELIAGGANGAGATELTSDRPPRLLVPALTAPRRAKALRPSELALDSGLRVLAVRKPGVPLVELRLRIPFLSARAAHSAKAELLSETLLTGTANLRPHRPGRGRAGAGRACSGSASTPTGC